MSEVGLVRFAKMALEVAEAVLPDYRSKFSKHVFTQPQLLAILCLMRYEDWTLRKAEVRLAEHSELRSALGLHKAPDHTTLYRFVQRLDENPARCPKRDRPAGARPEAGPTRASSNCSGRCHRLGSGRNQHLLRAAHAKPRWQADALAQVAKVARLGRHPTSAGVGSRGLLGALQRLCDVAPAGG